MNSSAQKDKEGSASETNETKPDETNFRTYRESHKINPPSGQQTLCQVQPFLLMSHSIIRSS